MERGGQQKKNQRVLLVRNKKEEGRILQQASQHMPTPHSSQHMLTPQAEGRALASLPKSLLQLGELSFHSVPSSSCGLTRRLHHRKLVSPLSHNCQQPKVLNNWDPSKQSPP